MDRSHISSRRALLAAGLVLVARQAAAEPMGVRPSQIERDVMQTIPLVLESGARRTLERIRLDIGGTVVEIVARGGVTQTNQNRLRLDGLPLIGGLFAERFSSDDLTAEHKLADAFLDNGVLWLHLARGFAPTQLPRVVVLNGDFSYEIDRPELTLASGVNPAAACGERLGTAFLARDRSLILLVPPSIITKGPL